MQHRPLLQQLRSSADCSTVRICPKPGLSIVLWCLGWQWHLLSSLKWLKRATFGAGVAVTVLIPSIVWCYSVEPDLSWVHLTLMQSRRLREKTNQTHTAVQRWAREQHYLQVHRCPGSSLLTSYSPTPGFHGENPTHILIINPFSWATLFLFIIPHFCFYDTKRLEWHETASHLSGQSVSGLGNRP